MDLNATTRDVGTQSIQKIGSDSPSPASTPPIVERALKRCEFEEDSPNSNSNITPETEVCHFQSFITLFFIISVLMLLVLVLFQLRLN